MPGRVLDGADIAAVLGALDALGIAVEITDDEGRYLAVSPRWQAITGYTADEARGRTPAEILRSGAHPPAFYAAMWDAVSSGRLWRGRMASRRQDGHQFWCEVAIAPSLDGAGRARRHIALKRDLTDEELVAEGHRTLFESAGDALLVADLATAQVLDANPAACALFERTREEMRALTGRLLTAPGQDAELADLSRQINEAGRGWHPNLEQVTGTGRRFWAEIRVTTFAVAGHSRYVAIIRDVTERVERERALARSNEELRAMQAQLVHAGKLAAIGELAAAVVHEVNNPAGYALLNLDHLLERLQRAEGGVVPVAEIRELVEECVVALRRIGSITRDLKVFSRAEVAAEREPCDLNELVRVASRMASLELRHRARLTLDLGDLPAIEASPGRLTQVLVNLLVNAAHAIEPGAAERHAVRVTTRRHGDDVVIEVVDTGCGIPEELRERVFDPFFTTKPRHEGTGLGLSLCAEIVRQHGGAIDLDSRVGEGTRVVVRLPVPATGAPPARARSTTSTPPLRRRVLLVDDDAAMLRAYRRILGARCDVVAVGGGEAALAVLAADDRFDVILCDLAMPEGDGVDVYEWLRAHRPALVEGFVVCTGGALTPRGKALLASGEVRSIGKPIDAATLRRIVDGTDL